MTSPTKSKMGDTHTSTKVRFPQAKESMNVYHNEGGAVWSSPLTLDTSYGDDGRNCITAPYDEPHSIRVTGVTDFSPFVIKSDGTPTAVMLGSFSADGQTVSVWVMLMILLVMVGTAVLWNRWSMIIKNWLQGRK